MDRLQILIDQYNQNIIPLERLESELEFNYWQVDTEQGRKRTALISRLKSNIYNESVSYEDKTPEEIVLEKERHAEILSMLKLVREIIGDKYYKILCLYAVNKWTQQRIAEHVGLTQQRVYSILRQIPIKIASVCKDYPEFYSLINKNSLLPLSSLLEASSPESIGYPFEFLQNVSVGGSWSTNRRGKKTYISHKSCLLPQYFKDSFHNDNVVCTLCTKCKYIGGTSH